MFPMIARLILNPLLFDLKSLVLIKIKGTKGNYQRKYYAVITLLYVTKTNVWIKKANIIS